MRQGRIDAGERGREGKEREIMWELSKMKKNRETRVRRRRRRKKNELERKRENKECCNKGKRIEEK